MEPLAQALPVALSNVSLHKMVKNTPVVRDLRRPDVHCDVSVNVTVEELTALPGALFYASLHKMVKNTPVVRDLRRPGVHCDVSVNVTIEELHSPWSWACLCNVLPWLLRTLHHAWSMPTVTVNWKCRVYFEYIYTQALQPPRKHATSVGIVSDDKLS